MVKKYFTDESLAALVDEIKTGDAESLSSAKSYVDTEVAKKANSSHTHDDRYYTESEIDTKISNVNSTISTHTGNNTIHITSDERTKWNSAYSHSTSTHAPSNAERNIIIGIQKNGTDLTVNSSTRKINITVPTTASDIGAATSGHNHDSAYDSKGSANNALTSAKTYTDEKIANLLNNSTEAVDSIMELAEAMENNTEAIEALETVAASKVPTSRKINGKALTSDITLSASDVGADANGSASAVQTNLDSHTGNTTVHITSTERTNWNAAKTHADSAHAPSNAEKNQNAFSNVVVGSTTIAADKTTDSLTLVGSNVTLTPDATNDKVTIGITQANVVSALGYTPQTSGSYAAASHTHDDRYYTETEIDTKLEGKANSSHTHNDATTSASGFMTSTMVTKLNGIATGATKVIVDSALLSSSTNPVQNKVIVNALDTVTNAVTANTSSISAHTQSIAALQTSVAEFEEITSAEISQLFQQ